jgi:hypothetical protein
MRLSGCATHVWRLLNEARQLIEGASYGPEALKIVCQAFDDAWSSIAANFEGDPSAIEAARLKLANIILSFPHSEIRDVEQIRNSWLQIMALSYGSPPGAHPHEGVMRTKPKGGQLGESPGTADAQGPRQR